LSTSYQQILFPIAIIQKNYAVDY